MQLCHEGKTQLGAAAALGTLKRLDVLIFLGESVRTSGPQVKGFVKDLGTPL